MLTFFQNNYYKKYEKNEKGINLLITFLFLIFFFFFINQTTSINTKNTNIINMFLLLTWYGLILILT